MPQLILLLDLQQPRRREQQANAQLSVWATQSRLPVGEFALVMPQSVWALKSRRLLSGRNVKD